MLPFMRCFWNEQGKRPRKRGFFRVLFFIAKKVTMVRPACAQPWATAHQPKLVTKKTRYFIRAFVRLPRLLGSLAVFQYPISFYRPLTDSDLFLHEIGLHAARTVFGHSPVPIRNDSFLRWFRCIGKPHMSSFHEMFLKWTRKKGPWDGIFFWPYPGSIWKSSKSPYLGHPLYQIPSCGIKWPLNNTSKT